ncbi:hypothetical protein QBC40DRAFT_285078 [Triangularia verruculosa]|uniref:C3H1-type domain-containing protein n=1 Tax=Triangularia verruculosa TaxID=2587418 RepID=A0AAN6XBS6_9PEZI|nr:hypothetical protein QBC40DRAFT_285078 [Triangularia verruculosa]
MMDSEIKEECLLFVDDSNVWIEAQKFAASGNSYMPKLNDDDHDPRLRINIGKLAETLCNGRTQVDSYLYGSRPPPNDSVWDQYNKRGFKTKIYNRGSNGKEKEVDNSMAVDLTENAVELRADAKHDPVAKEKKDRTIFIVITGDRDLLPAVRTVLRSGIRVEQWGWRSGMAQEYLAERNDNALLSVKFLDNIFSQVSFTNFRSTRQRGSVDPPVTIVLQQPESSVAEALDEDFVAKTLLRLGRLFFLSNHKTETDIFAEFPKVKEKVGDMEKIILQARKLFGKKATVISWPESRFSKDKSCILETSNMFSPLGDDGTQSSSCSTTSGDQESDDDNIDVCGPPSPETKHTGAQEIQSRSQHLDDDSGSWGAVSRSQPAKVHANAQRRSQQCPHGQHCRAQGDCGFKHTYKESNRFRENVNGNINFGKYKTKLCTYHLGSGCHKGKNCAFAHSKEELCCRSCRGKGHLTEECRI